MSSMLSWYDALESRFARENRGGGRQSFTRVLYLARVVKGVSTAEMENYHVQIMEQLQSYHDARLTGILLINTDTVLHLLEGPTELLTNLFRHFNISSPGLNKYNGIKVLLASEDCPERRLPVWTRYVLQAAPEKDVQVDREHINNEIMEVYNKLVEFGQLLVATTEESQPAQQSQLRRALGQLPSNERLLVLSSLAEVSSLEEYLEIYDAPIEIDLEGDKIWPAQPSLPPPKE